MQNPFQSGRLALKTAARSSLRLGISALCALEVLAIAVPSQAQSLSHPITNSIANPSAPIVKESPLIDSAASESETHALLPLHARKLEAPDNHRGLAQVSDTLNARIENDQQADKEDGFQLGSLPIIGELVDESGNLDMGIDLPFEMSISDVMGETGLILSTDFTVD